MAIFTLLALAVVFLTIVPVGLATFWLGFLRGDSPCVMCWEQRTGLLLIALTGLFVLRFGPRPKYVGIALLIAAWGLFMGLRHVGMHAARDVGQGFSLEILGAHTYTWALFTYWACVLIIALLLLLVRPEHFPAGPRVLRGVERLAGATFLVVVGANAVQAFASTGPPPFMGQSDPVRFSLNPRHWHWSLEEWKPVRVSLRGRWNVDKPDLSRVSEDPAGSPLGAVPRLVISERRPLGITLDGPPTDLTWDPVTDQFLVTTAHGIYLTDATLSECRRYTIVDPGYSADLGRFAGAAFLDDGALIAIGENKSYVVLQPNDSAKADANFRYFLESSDRFSEITRGRFSTVRARLHYIQSAAYDPGSNSIFTVAVPNARVRRLIVSRFDRSDLTLSEEYLPALAPASGLALAPDRALDELTVTGAAVADGQLHAMSATYGMVLVIDLASRQIVSARMIGDLTRPVGFAIRGDDYYVLGEDGTLVIANRRSGEQGRWQSAPW